MKNVDTMTNPAVVEAAEAVVADGGTEVSETADRDLMGALSELKTTRGAEARAARQRLESLLRPQYAPDQVNEACQASWDGLHRSIADGGNPYME